MHAPMRSGHTVLWQPHCLKFDFCGGRAREGTRGCYTLPNVRLAMPDAAELILGKNIFVTSIFTQFTLCRPHFTQFTLCPRAPPFCPPTPCCTCVLLPNHEPGVDPTRPRRCRVWDRRMAQRNTLSAAYCSIPFDFSRQQHSSSHEQTHQ